MKNTVLLFVAICAIALTTSCEKAEMTEPVIVKPAPTVTLKKSTAYSDQIIVTPENSVLIGEFVLNVENGPVVITPTVTLSPSDTLAVKYTSLKNMYLTITGIESASNKKNPAQSGSTFDPATIEQNGLHTVRIYAAASQKFSNGMVSSLEVSYQWWDPVKGEYRISSTGTVKGQTLTFK